MVAAGLGAAFVVVAVVDEAAVQDADEEPSTSSVRGLLRLAQEAAAGRDVRIGGGPSTVRQFLTADMIDFMHLVLVPITLGRSAPTSEP